MEPVEVRDPVVVVLADGASTSAVNNTKGHLFEDFIARVLSSYGYENPDRKNIGVNQSGVELDVVVRHTLDGVEAIAECKAYSSPVSSEKLSAFYGKLAARRLESGSEIRGLFVAIPKLTADSAEMARKIRISDQRFMTIDAASIWDLLISKKLIRPIFAEDRQFSDSAVIVHRSGIYSAAVEIDRTSRTGLQVVVDSIQGSVNSEAISLIAENSYAQGLPVVPLRNSGDAVRQAAHPDQVIVAVTGSGSDFEYQRPASPKYFIGRRRSVQEISRALSSGTKLLVMNAQSGWGKSSLALKVAATVHANGGYATVIDSRTANRGGYVPAVLRRAALAAENAGVLRISPDASWATVSSSLRSLEESEWGEDPATMLVFFDQFENVFKDTELTQEFRDLALAATDGSGGLAVGFAWKTDYVDWTENHPYQLRDEIRGRAKVVALDPLGPKDVEVILKRLENAAGQKLSREIRQRLREYSQGLPWLLKKLAGHLISEMRGGTSQEQLVTDGLNVQRLFDSDLASLNPTESEALKFVARYAPISAADVTEKYSPSLVQSLLDQRLIIQVGERLDTYWDIFRDYLNTGSVPIQDSYILRVTPASVARLLSVVVGIGQGDMSVSEITKHLSTSENVVWNASRELRLLGLAAYVPNRVRLLPEILASSDLEFEIRRRVATALRRHRAYTIFLDLAEKASDPIAIQAYARKLPGVFPAVDVAESTWQTYARAYVAWFEYAGLAVGNSQHAGLAPDGTKGKGSLLKVRRVGAEGTVFPNVPPGPSVKFLIRIATAGTGQVPKAADERIAMRQLMALGALTINEEAGTIVPKSGLVVEGQIVPTEILSLILGVPGGNLAVEKIVSNPAASPIELGKIFAQELRAIWSLETTKGVGKSFRGWARIAGLPTSRGQRSRYPSDPSAQTLF